MSMIRLLLIYALFCTTNQQECGNLWLPENKGTREQIQTVMAGGAVGENPYYIAKGSFGAVYRSQDGKSAIKVMQFRAPPQQGQELTTKLTRAETRRLKSFRREAVFLKAISELKINANSQIINNRAMSYHGCWIDSKKGLFVIETGLYNGSLTDQPFSELLAELQSQIPNRFALCKFSHLMFQMAEAVDNLHSLGIRHVDIKPQNFLYQTADITTFKDATSMSEQDFDNDAPFTDGPQVVVSDLGDANFTDDCNLNGTSFYTPPEKNTNVCREIENKRPKQKQPRKIPVVLKANKLPKNPKFRPSHDSKNIPHGGKKTREELLKQMDLKAKLSQTLDEEDADYNVVADCRATFARDIWALGMSFAYILIDEEQLFFKVTPDQIRDKNNSDVYENVIRTTVKKNIDKVIKSHNQALAENGQDELSPLYNLIKQMLRYKPALRPTSSEVKEQLFVIRQTLCFSNTVLGKKKSKRSRFAPTSSFDPLKKVEMIEGEDLVSQEIIAEQERLEKEETLIEKPISQPFSKKKLSQKSLDPSKVTQAQVVSVDYNLQSTEEIEAEEVARSQLQIAAASYTDAVLTGIPEAIEETGEEGEAEYVPSVEEIQNVAGAALEHPEVNENADGFDLEEKAEFERI